MKLWVLTTEYPPQSGGGISTYCWHTAKMMAAEGIATTVFIPASQSESHLIKEQEKNIRLVYFRQDNNNQNRFLGWETALSYEFSKVLKEFQDREGEPDFVEAQEYGGIAYYPLQRRLLEENYLRKSVFFVTAHAPGFLYLEYNQAPAFQFPQYWIGEMERSVLRTADFVLSPSQYLLSELKSRVDLGSVTAHVLRNPFMAFDPAPGYVEGDLVFFGKLTPQKGGLEMLQYFQEMWDNGFKGAIRIIGSGEHFFYPKMMDMGDFVRKKFSKYIAEGLIIFEGHLAPARLEERISRAHAVIIPSTVDNLPYTVLEAMSLGKVVLVSEQGGHAELINHGINGFTFSHHSKGSFASAIKDIVNLTPEKIIEIGSKAHQTIVEECSYQSVFRKKLDLLKSLKPKRRSNEFPYIRTREFSPDVKRKNNEGLLSVIIPFYNLSEYIEACVISILNSDYTDLEVIIINDGSTELNSSEILNSIGGKYAVKIHHQKNSGLCETRNTGARLASGEFLAFLDADDTVHPSYYTKAIRVLREFDNVNFVGCWAQYFGENDEIWPAFNPEPPYLLTHNMINSSAVVYKTSCFLAVKGNDPKMIYGMEDYETIINLVKNGFQGVVIPEILWNYRIRSGSMAQSFNRFSELYLYRLISKKHAGFFSEYAEELANLLNSNGSGIDFNNPTFERPAASSVVQFHKEVSRNSRIIKFIKQNRILRKLAKKIYIVIFRP